ncbi:hypothetical protein Tco_0648222 [Tanacetum coccineum]
MLTALSRFDDRIRPAEFTSYPYARTLLYSWLGLVTSHRATLDCYARLQRTLISHGCQFLYSEKLNLAFELVPYYEPISKGTITYANQLKLKEFKEQLQEIWRMALLDPVFSPWGITVLFVKKKDGKHAHVY